MNAKELSLLILENITSENPLLCSPDCSCRHLSSGLSAVPNWLAHACFTTYGNLRPSKSYQLVLVMNVSNHFLAPIPAIFERYQYCLDNLFNKFKKINEIKKQVKSNGNEVNRTGILRILKYGTDDINT